MSSIYTRIDQSAIDQWTSSFKRHEETKDDSFSENRIQDVSSWKLRKKKQIDFAIGRKVDQWKCEKLRKIRRDLSVYPFLETWSTREDIRNVLSFESASSILATMQGNSIDDHSESCLVLSINGQSNVRCVRYLQRDTRTSPLISIGGRLKRRLRNLLIVSVVGLGTFYGYRGYRRYKWFNEVSDSDQAVGTRPRVVVLGTGKEEEHRDRSSITAECLQVGELCHCWNISTVENTKWCASRLGITFWWHHYYRRSALEQSRLERWSNRFDHWWDHEWNMSKPTVSTSIRRRRRSRVTVMERMQSLVAMMWRLFSCRRRVKVEHRQEKSKIQLDHDRNSRWNTTS